ncbi:SURF1 family protein [Aurantimonas sp. VKM B-3413]|uniref:SURF1 family protein n=1 Tax=Aurantimonas sp. VKM B-3413 TaxID=2779401 RepID=UPI00210329F6|nr:SURF1 family protein [Aurantimonas sp. VKM B-3413]
MPPPARPGAAPPQASDPAAGRAASPVRSLRSLLLLGLAGAILFAGFVGLGIWQIERRAWKLDLIAKVDARVHAAPVPAPGPAEWPEISAKADQYRHVSVDGHFLDDHETLVKAVTDLGSGYWLLVPFMTDRGFTVLVNRGFVPSDWRDAASRAPRGAADGATSVAGLLRVSEPGGAFLRENAPAGERWYSRDVAAIAQARGLAGPVAPYFIDAEANGPRTAYPVGGLTVIAFRNEHLVYALTWFGLALLVVVAAFVVVWDQRRRRGDTPGGEDGRAAG